MRRLVLLTYLLLLALAPPAVAAGVDGERSVEVVDVLFGARTTVARVPGTDGTLSVAAFSGAEVSVLDSTDAATTLSVLPGGGGAPLATFPWPQLGPYASAEPLPGGERFLTTLRDRRPLLVNRDGGGQALVDLTRLDGYAVAPDGRVAFVYGVPGPPPKESDGAGYYIDRWPPGGYLPASGDTFRLRTVDAIGTALSDVPTDILAIDGWLPEGLVALVPGPGDRVRRVVLDPTTGAVTRTLAAPRRRSSEVLSPDGLRLASVSYDAQGEASALVLRDAATGATLDALRLPDGRRSAGTASVRGHELVWSPDGTRLALSYVRTQGRRRATGVDLLTMTANHISWRSLITPGDRWRGNARWSDDSTRLAVRNVVAPRQLPRPVRACRRADFGLAEYGPPWVLVPAALRGNARCTTARRVAVRYLVLGARAVPAWRCQALAQAQVRCRSRTKTFSFTVI